MSYYDKNIKCMYHISDGVLYYHSIATRKVYSRPMIPEIDRIFNTMRLVSWRDGCKRFDKIIYENELISINRYVIGEDKVFTLEPPYPKGQEIIRYHGEVPLFINGQPAEQPKYKSPEYAEYLREQRKLDSQPEKKARRLKRLEYLREYQRRKRQQKKQQSNNNN